MTYSVETACLSESHNALKDQTQPLSLSIRSSSSSSSCCFWLSWPLLPFSSSPQQLLGRVAKYDDLISRLICPLLSGCAQLMGDSGRNWKEVQSEVPSPATAFLIAIPSSSCCPQHGQDVLPIQPLGVFQMALWGPHPTYIFAIIPFIQIASNFQHDYCSLLVLSPCCVAPACTANLVLSLAPVFQSACLLSFHVYPKSTCDASWGQSPQSPRSLLACTPIP